MASGGFDARTSRYFGATPRRCSMRWARRLGVAVGRLVASVATAGIAAGHEVGATRFDSPLPLSLLFVGAGATVGLTAAWLGRTENSLPSGTRVAGRLPAGAMRALRIAGRIGFGVLVVAAIARGLTGRQVAAENFATVFVWPLWLKGIGLVAVLVGSPWRALSPWRGVHALLERLEERTVAVGEYPARLGVWPAVVGFVATVGVIENLTVVARSPRLTAGLVALYAVGMVLGGLAFGRSWFARGDCFEVLFRQFGRVAPVRIRERDGRWIVETRYPWDGCTDAAPRPGAAVFVVAMVYTVSFDGFTGTPEYQQVLDAGRTAVGTGALTGLAVYVIGLAGFVVSFAGAAALVERIGDAGETARTTALAFAPTVLPIAAAYEIAHNYPFVIRNLGQAFDLATGAVGVPVESVDLLGWLSLPAFWGSQVLLIVAGHVAAVVAAHAVAVRRYGSLVRARRAHLPLVVVMIGYTVLSLWIVSRPVVAG